MLQERLIVDKNGDRFDRYVSYLDLDWGEGDYWSDFGFLHAEELMDGFSDTDWVNLRGVCASKGTAWQIRCAGMLDGTVNPAAVEILMSLMASQNREVVMAAAETLLSLAQTGTSVDVTPQLSALISKARMNGGDPYGFVLDLLLKNTKT